MLLRTALLGAAMAMSVAFVSADVAYARHGADDPAGDVRQGRGADDPATHDVNDDRGGAAAARGRNGADDPPNHDANDDRGGAAAAAATARGGVDDPANHEPAGDRQRGRGK